MLRSRRIFVWVLRHVSMSLGGMLVWQSGTVEVRECFESLVWDCWDAFACC
jgi:hypothetical protein